MMKMMMRTLVIVLFVNVVVVVVETRRYRRERRGGRRELFQEEARASSESDGLYYVHLNIGTPTPQEFTAIVDTGSSSIAVPCEGCDCGDNKNHFYQDRSETCREVGEYVQCYMELSCNKGKKLKDRMCIGEHCGADEMVAHEFGCCTTYAASFQVQDSDGIIGFGGSESTLIGALRAHHNLDRDMFALCVGKGSGHLDIGGFDSSINLEPMQWVETSTTGYYHVRVESVVLDGGGDNRAVSFEAKKALIDSGTTYSYIPRDQHRALKTQFKEFCDADPETRCLGVRNPSDALKMDLEDSIACYDPPPGVSPDDSMWLNTFPTIELKLANANVFMCVDAEQYMFRSRDDKSVMCVGLLRDYGFVLGANVMRDFNFVFDADKSRIGIARAWCGDMDDVNTQPRCCGMCAVNGEPRGPYEWCVDDLVSQNLSRACNATCEDDTLLLVRNASGCKSLNNFLVNDSFCEKNTTTSRTYFYQCPPDRCDSAKPFNASRVTPQFPTCPMDLDTHKIPVFPFVPATSNVVFRSTSFAISAVILCLILSVTMSLVVFIRGHGERGGGQRWVQLQRMDEDENVAVVGDDDMSEDAPASSILLPDIRDEERRGLVEGGDFKARDSRK